jgi:hypothetical protein
MSSARFRARVTLDRDDGKTVEVWDDDLSPYGKGGKLPVRDWVRYHFDDWSEKDFRERFELQAEGNYEVLVEGTIAGSYSGPGGDDYEEDIEFSRIEVQQIPAEWYQVGDSVPDNADPIPSIANEPEQPTTDYDVLKAVAVGCRQAHQPSIDTARRVLAKLAEAPPETLSEVFEALLEQGLFTDEDIEAPPATAIEIEVKS